MEDATIIAHGGQPAWEETFEHPEHGQLAFKVRELPRNRDWLRHATLQEQLAPGLSAGSGGNALFAASIAGLLTFMELPELSRKEEADPDNPDHVKVKILRYDPLEDDDIAFPVKVWTSFFNWRADLLSDRTRDAVKNFSRATSGDSDADASPASTESPLPTLA